MLVFRSFLTLTFILLTACSNSPEKLELIDQAATTATQTQASKAVAEKAKKVAETAIDPDVLFMFLTAELAGQRGQYDIALEGYMEAAKRVNDPKLTERATAIAMYLKDGNKTKELVKLWLKQDAKNPSAQKLATLVALRTGDKAGAIEHLNAFLEIDAKDFENSLPELIGPLQKETETKLTYDVLEALAVKHPQEASIYFAQSLLAMQLKDKTLAEKKIEQTLKLRPDWDKALIFQAQIAALSNDTPKAKSLLQDAITKYPDNNKIKKLLAQVLIKSEDYAGAAKVYEGIIAAEPKDSDSRLALGLVYLQLNDDNAAKSIFEKLLNKTDKQAQASFYLGKIEEKRNNNKQAVIWFDKVNEEPFNFEAGISAVAALTKDKQFAEVEKRLANLTKAFPKQKQRILLAQIELYSQQKQYEKAFNLLSNELKAQPEQRDLLYTRALIAERMGKASVLETDLKKILRTEPDNVSALNALGYTLLDQPSRYAEAERYLQKAIDLQPDEAVIIDSYGWLQFKLGHLDKALELLQKAYSRQAENEILAHLAEVLWVLNRKDEAKELFYKALKTAPDDEYLLDFQRRILDKAR
ncbi:MAG: tetratricopeptide repeat protein [Methylococcaceae bacterium]